jgi:hypothetical protein
MLTSEFLLLPLANWRPSHSSLVFGETSSPNLQMYMHLSPFLGGEKTYQCFVQGSSGTDWSQQNSAGALFRRSLMTK